MSHELQGTVWRDKDPRGGATFRITEVYPGTGRAFAHVENVIKPLRPRRIYLDRLSKYEMLGNFVPATSRCGPWAEKEHTELCLKCNCLDLKLSDDDEEAGPLGF